MSAITVVGLDVGTSGVKGIALAPDGTVVARASRHYPLSTPHPQWSEQDPDDWWRASSEVMEELSAKAGPPSGIGLSGQMHGLVALDASDRPVRPAILWNDQRCEEECDQIEERIGFDRLIQLTGNRALTGFTAPKLLWMRSHEPATYERIRSVLLPKDYVRLQLCGEHAGDVSDCSGTLLFDVAARDWSEAVTSELEIERDWLPPALESPVISGRTADGIPVAAGAGDQAAGALGVGVLTPGPVSVVLGTSGVVFAALDDYAPDPLGRTHTFCHAVPGRWHSMGVMLSAAGSLEWLRSALGTDLGFDELVAEAERWEPGTEGLVFLPYLVGERTPHADPEARASFVGITVRHDRGALVRAVLEGVCFGLRDCLDVLTESGVDATAGIASGGGAASDTWLRIAASVLGLPLARTSVSDGAAFGAALLGGVAAGVWRDVEQASQATVRITETIDPDPVWSARYAESQEWFRALYPATRRGAPADHRTRERT